MGSDVLNSKCDADAQRCDVVVVVTKQRDYDKITDIEYTYIYIIGIII